MEMWYDKKHKGWKLETGFKPKLDWSLLSAPGPRLPAFFVH